MIMKTLTVLLAVLVVALTAACGLLVHTVQQERAEKAALESRDDNKAAVMFRNQLESIKNDEPI